MRNATKVIDMRTGKESRPVRYYAESKDASGRIVRKVRRMDLKGSGVHSADRRSLKGGGPFPVALVVVVALILVL